MAAPVPMTVADAHAFFKAAHAGQVDKQDRDYYTGHLVPIAEKVAHLGDLAVIAALGHDYIEDVHHGVVGAGIAALAAAGCPDPAIIAIVSVTRMPGESYADLIGRSCADPIGVEIKLADNAHNIESNPGLAATDPEKAKSLLVGRYLPARDRLVEAATLHRLGLYPAHRLSTEYGREIINDACGNGHLIGHVSSISRTRAEAAAGGNGAGLHADQRLVTRTVGPWIPVDPAEPDTAEPDTAEPEPEKPGS